MPEWWGDILRLLHVVGATVLFGTGAGIAFFMVMAHRTKNPALIAHVASTVVVADTLFTATGWIVLSLLLYVLTGLFWLPVVAIQLRLRDLARAAAANGEALPPAYFRLYRVWFVCGFPAFFAVIGILWLMLVKPTLF